MSAILSHPTRLCLLVVLVLRGCVPTAGSAHPGIATVVVREMKVTVTVDPSREIVQKLCKPGYRPQELMARLRGMDPLGRYHVCRTQMWHMCALTQQRQSMVRRDDGTFHSVFNLRPHSELVQNGIAKYLVDLQVLTCVKTDGPLFLLRHKDDLERMAKLTHDQWRSTFQCPETGVGANFLDTQELKISVSNFNAYTNTLKPCGPDAVLKGYRDVIVLRNASCPAQDPLCLSFAPGFKPSERGQIEAIFPTLNCRVRHYYPATLAPCLSQTKVLIVGDSVTDVMYSEAVVSVVNRAPFELSKPELKLSKSQNWDRQPSVVPLPEGGSFDYILCQQSAKGICLNKLTEFAAPNSYDWIVLNVGLHDLVDCKKIPGDPCTEDRHIQYRQNLARLLDAAKARAKNVVYRLTASTSVGFFAWNLGDKNGRSYQCRDPLSDDRIAMINAIARELCHEKGVTVWDPMPMSLSMFDWGRTDTLHFLSRRGKVKSTTRRIFTAHIFADVLFSHLCKQGDGVPEHLRSLRGRTLES